MLRRQFGDTDLFLPLVSFGSMRLSPERLSIEEGVHLFHYLVDSGINTFHSSREYDTYPYYSEILKQFLSQYPKTTLQHIVKVASPHFGETKFDPIKCRQWIESELTNLQTDCLDIVQWLVRSKPIEDSKRLPLLKDCEEEASLLFEQLKREGKLREVVSFPYSTLFSETILKVPFCKGLTTYLNLCELDMVPLLDSASNLGKGMIAIRPLAAGNLSNKASDVFSKETQKVRASIADRLGISIQTLMTHAYQFPLLHPVVSSMMVSLHSREQVDAVVSSVETLLPNKKQFSSMYDLLSQQFVSQTIE